MRGASVHTPVKKRSITRLPKQTNGCKKFTPGFHGFLRSQGRKPISGSCQRAGNGHFLAPQYILGCLLVHLILWGANAVLTKALYIAAFRQQFPVQLVPAKLPFCMSAFTHALPGNLLVMLHDVLNVGTQLLRDSLAGGFLAGNGRPVSRGDKRKRIGALVRLHGGLCGRSRDLLRLLYGFCCSAPGKQRSSNDGKKDKR